MCLQAKGILKEYHTFFEDKANFICLERGNGIRERSEFEGKDSKEAPLQPELENINEKL